MAAALACLEPPILSKASAIALNQNSQNLLLLDATVVDDGAKAMAGHIRRAAILLPFFCCLVGAIVSGCAAAVVVDRLVVERDGAEVEDGGGEDGVKWEKTV